MNTQHLARDPRPSAALVKATGRDRSEWFAALDAWKAGGRPYREIADWLTVEHRVSAWWAQKLIVEYEEARGLRDPGIRRDGTFEVGATRTVAAPVDRLVAAFVDPEIRDRWLPGAVMRQRASEPSQPLRFDWQDGPSRLSVTFRGRRRCQKPGGRATHAPARCPDSSLDEGLLARATDGLEGCAGGLRPARGPALWHLEENGE
jgi:hypothetical protein